MTAPPNPFWLREVPGYWMNETSGVLPPAVWAYLRGEPMSERQIAVLRAYFQQWISAPGFAGPEIERLRGEVLGLTTRAAIDRWLTLAEQAGADPL